MLGIYNYTVIITYLSVVSAGIGMYFSTQHEIKTAIFFLMFSGLCDMLDGPVSRTLKTRTETAKKFGIQIDSLCDCISFCVQPAVFYYCFVQFLASDCSWIKIVSLVGGIVLMICGVIRLAYFNVTEEERQKEEGNKLRAFYRGLPVTNTTLIVPLFYLCGFFTTGLTYACIMIASEFLTAFLFVFDFKFPKVHGLKLIPVGIGALFLFIGVCLV